MTRLFILLALVACDKVDLRPPTPYKMVDELVPEAAKYKDRELKVHGWVKAGSLEARVVRQESIHAFLVEKSKRELRVIVKGPVPDTLKDGMEVVATGRLAAIADQRALVDDSGTKPGPSEQYVLLATDLAAKCPTNYDRREGTKPDFK